MPEPLSEEQRAAVLEAARQPGATRNGIVRLTGVSAGAVTTICAEAGVSFDRAATETAVRARAVDLRAARLGLATELLDDVAVARGRMHAAEDNRAFLEAARAVAALSGTHVRLVAVDRGDDAGIDTARSMLGRLATAIGVTVAEAADEGAGHADDET